MEIFQLFKLGNQLGHCVIWYRVKYGQNVVHTSTGRHVLKLNITPKIGLGEGHRYYSPSYSIKINQA